MVLTKPEQAVGGVDVVVVIPRDLEDLRVPNATVHLRLLGNGSPTVPAHEGIQMRSIGSQRNTVRAKPGTRNGFYPGRVPNRIEAFADAGAHFAPDVFGVPDHPSGFALRVGNGAIPPIGNSKEFAFRGKQASLDPCGAYIDSQKYIAHPSSSPLVPRSEPAPVGLPESASSSAPGACGGVTCKICVSPNFMGNVNCRLSNHPTLVSSMS